MPTNHHSDISVLLDSDSASMSQIMTMIGSVQKIALKKGLAVKICFENEYEQILREGARTVIVAGIASEKMYRVLETLKEAGKRIVIINFDPEYIDAGFSCVTFSRRQATEQILEYLCTRGASRVALIGCGIGSSNDDLHIQAMREFLKRKQMNEGAYFYYERAIQESFEAFYRRRDEFDTVLSVNPYVAVAFLRFCEDHGVRIPEDYLLACIRDSYICRCCRPTITTLSENAAMIGEQAVVAWQYLENNPSGDVRIRIDVRGNIVERESTVAAGRASSPPRCAPDGDALRESVNYEGGPFYQDETVRQLISLERCLFHCDELDFRIIAEMAEGTTNEKIAEKLFLSTSALQYRMNKLYQLTGTSGKTQFVRIVTDFFTHNYRFQRI